MFYREKQRVTKIVINDTKSCPVQLESGPLKVSCHRINYLTIVRCDYRRNPSLL